MSDNQNSLGVLGGFIMGGLIGAGLALLLAPATGDATRRRLMDGASGLADGAQHGIDMVKERVQDLKGSMSDGVAAGKQEIRTASNRIA